MVHYVIMHVYISVMKLSTCTYVPKKTYMTPIAIYYVLTLGPVTLDSDQSTTIPGSTTTFTTISTATMPLESTSKSSTIPPLQSTIANFSQVDLLVPSVAAVAGIAMTLMVVAIVAGILTLIWKIRKVRSKRKVQTVATGRSNSNEIEMLSVNCGFENRNVSYRCILNI